MSGSKIGSYLIALLLFAVGVFYAFNALIQLRERGFSEPQDIPIAVAAILIGGFIFIAARGR
jgi:divalent metal cation (Fe/Co/Zn/Cd) transporter